MEAWESGATLCAHASEPLKDNPRILTAIRVLLLIRKNLLSIRFCMGAGSR
jgi:hypothetical protein